MASVDLIDRFSKRVSKLFRHEKASNDAITVEDKVQKSKDKFYKTAPMPLDETLCAALPFDTFSGYDHLTLYVSNAKVSASFFVSTLGFEPYVFRGLETGSRSICCQVVRNNNVVIQFTSALTSEVDPRDPDAETVTAIHRHLKKHGDSVKDVAFTTNDVQKVYESVLKAGGKSLMAPMRINNSKDGSIAIARVCLLGDTTHTLVERQNYKGFLPGYESYDKSPQWDWLAGAVSLRALPAVDLVQIDHCVQNHGWDQMIAACQVYANAFGFHKFWSVDEKDVSTEFSALRSIVMVSSNEEIKMPFNEPAEGRCKSQIEEFLEFYEGPGIQHVALLTKDILSAVDALRARGIQFISVPEIYYENLRQRLVGSTVKIKEDMEEIQRLGILVDFDDNGYLLQLFTKPMGDRPTLFLEIIQRCNHNGFGQGNFKALFETLEQDQRLRGNLV